MTKRLLLVAGGVCAFVGAGLMGYKGVAILVTGEQPDHAFEVAPFFFGVSALLLVSALINDLTRSRWLLLTLGWLAAVAGTVAAVAHFAGREDDFGDLGYLVNLVSTIVLLSLIGGAVRRKKLLGRWSFTPTMLALTIVLAIPVGAVLESVDERLLEVALLGIAAGWTLLGIAAVTTRPHTQPHTGNA